MSIEVIFLRVLGFLVDFTYLCLSEAASHAVRHRNVMLGLDDSSDSTHVARFFGSVPGSV